jgi:membrane-associated phospholipid phosphatase
MPPAGEPTSLDGPIDTISNRVHFGPIAPTSPRLAQSRERRLGRRFASTLTRAPRASSRGPDRIAWLVAATVCTGALFLLVAFAYRAGLTKDVDQATVAVLGGIENSTLDAYGQADDELARVIPTFAAAGLMAAVLAWKGRRWTWIVPLFIGAAAFVEFLAKVGIDQVLHVGAMLNAARELVGFRYHTGASFPSGHVARSAFLAAVALRLFPYWVAAPLVAFAAVTFLARLYTEDHRLSDVVGGLALGACAACAGLCLSAILRRSIS